MKRNPIDRSANRYCGPLAIAALLGLKSSVEGAARIRAIRDRPGLPSGPIKAVYNEEMVCTLRGAGLGVRHEPTGVAHNPTLAGWLRRHRKDRAGTYLVQVTRHYVVVSGRKFIDTSTDGQWVFLGKAPHRRKRVRNAYQVVRPQ